MSPDPQSLPRLTGSLGQSESLGILPGGYFSKRLERTSVAGQRYHAWFTEYPSTHEKAGETVEVVTRPHADGALMMARQEAKALYHALASVLETVKPLGLEAEAGALEEFDLAVMDAEVVLGSMEGDYGAP